MAARFWSSRVPAGSSKSSNKTTAASLTSNGGPSQMAPIFSTRQWASEPAAGSNEPHHQQEQDGADRRIDDLPHEAGADGNAELWKQQTGDQRAGDTDENIADDPKAAAAHDLSGHPA